MKISWDRFCLDLSSKTFVMGILNVTPDSFSDGGFHFEKERAIEHALKMVEDGADIIDIGGESTRPGSEAVSLEEELKRTIPVISALSGKVRVPLSIDTYRSAVAKRALESGASIVNDISGLRFDAEMAGVVSEFRVPVIIMHMKGTPKDMQLDPAYDDVVEEIREFFSDRIRYALQSRIGEEMIILDPGIGFGKTTDHNLEIIRRLDEFAVFNRPVLIGPSRKAFIGKILGGAPPQERVEGTAAAVACAIMKGASIVRVHDVKAMVRTVKVSDAIVRAGGIKKDYLG